MASQVMFYQGSINKTRQISLKIETYQLEGLVKDGTISHHAIDILSKGGSHFELRSKREVMKSMVRREERMREREQRNHPS